MNNYKLYVHISPSNKYYFGITSRDVKDRWSNGRGYSNPHFKSAIKKYGWDNFKHIVIMDNLSKEWACQLEKLYIMRYKTMDSRYGYNKCAGGEGTKGHIVSEELREKLRNQIISEEQKIQISNTVKKRWKEGVYINRKQNQTAWNKGLTKVDPRVAKYCRKKGEFKHKESSKKKMSISHKGIPAHNRKKVQCIETGIVYSSVVEAQKLTGINNISIAARDINRTAGTYHWRYLDD